MVWRDPASIAASMVSRTSNPSSSSLINCAANLLRGSPAEATRPQIPRQFPSFIAQYSVFYQHHLVDIETAARIQNIEVIPGLLRISNDEIDPDNQLECLHLPNLEVVEGSIRARDDSIGGPSLGEMPEEITFESLTTVGEDFSFAQLGESLKRIDALVLTTINAETDGSDDFIQGAYFVGNAGLVEVLMPSLEEAYHISVKENPVLETFDVSSFEEIARWGWVQVTENPSFSSWEAQAIGDEFGDEGRTEVCDNYDDGCDEACDG